MTEPIELVERLGRWSAGRGPLYVLLASRIRQLVDDGDLPAGTPLPPERSLGRALAVGRGTVVAAYDLLRTEGRVERRRGSGTRVAGRPAGWAPPTTSAPMFLHLFDDRDGVVSMDCAAPERPPAELVRAAEAAAGRLSSIEADIGYHPAGLQALRAAVAERFGRRGVPTDPEQVLVTNGGQQAISLLARALLRPGDRVVVETPTYSGALESFRAADAVLRAVPVGLGGLATALAEHRPTVVYAVPTHHNPTGATMGVDRRREVAHTVAGSGATLVEDEVLADLGFGQESAPPPIAAWSDAAVTVGSLSKSVWGGLRVGWLRGPRPLVARLARMRAVHDLGGSVLAQLTAVEVLPGLDDLLAGTAHQRRLRYAALTEELAARLPEWTFTPAGGGQTLWVGLPYGDGDSFAQTSLRHGVSVLAGSGLDVTDGGHRFLRLHFVHPPDVLRDAIRRLAAAWADYRAPDAPRRPSPSLAV